jgi:hypothetical protein
VPTDRTPIDCRHAGVSSGIQPQRRILWLKQSVSIAMKHTPVLLLIPFWLLAACTPTVQLAEPKEPITINLNVKIEHEIRVKVDKELDDVFANNADLF